MVHSSTSTQPRVHPVFLPLFVLATLIWPASLFAQTESTESNNESFQKITVGFSDSTRLGHWTPLIFEWSEPLSPAERPARFELSCLDGEGTSVIYRGNLDFDPGHPAVGQAWFRMGRKSSDIGIALFSGAKMELMSVRLVAERDFAVTASTVKTVLVIEPHDQMRKAIADASETGGESRVIIGVNSIAQLPMNALGYEGVDQIFLSTIDSGSIAKLSDLQIEALAHWIGNGGHFIFGVGQGGKSLLGEGGRLARFCPATFQRVTQLDSASRLQFFSDSESSLIDDGESLSLSEVADIQGVSRLAQDGIPIIIDQARGFGRITFVAIDVDSESFLDWNGKISFFRRLFFSETENTAAESRSPSGGRVSHYGYDDIIGQLRVPLDQFSKVQFVSFTWVAVLIGLYILCIGPGDYFLLKKVFGRMELTWITFGLITLVFCGIAWLTARNAKPDQVQINQLEIIDIDTVSGQTRGFVWANLFSPSTTTHDIELASTNRLGNELESKLLSWQGLPGSGLGGMQSISNASLISEGYTTVVDTRSTNAVTTLAGFPLRVSSSKPVFARWTASNAVRPQSNLRLNERIQQLDGTFTNPFDVPLRNCRLIFDNWVYVVDRTLEPGETIDVLTETREKNIRSYFTRRVSKDDKGTNTAWDPTDTHIPRIADMLMFYDAAGGQGYVGLTHSYQSITDLSQLPHLNRAILVGEIEEQTTEIMLDSESTSDDYDRALTVLRIVFPVERGSKQKR